jgi:hypothetical protein
MTTKKLETYEFDDGENIVNTRNMIVALGGNKLPVFPETWVCDGYDDDGRPVQTFYRKASETGFYATVYAR